VDTFDWRQPSLEGVDHIGHGYLVSRPAQHVTAVWAAPALDQPGLLQGIQDLDDERLRHVLAGRRRAGRYRDTMRLLRQIDE